MSSHAPDISRLEGIVSQQVMDAMKAASDILTKGKIRHALAGEADRDEE